MSSSSLSDHSGVLVLPAPSGRRSRSGPRSGSTESPAPARHGRRRRLIVLAVAALVGVAAAVGAWWRVRDRGSSGDPPPPVAAAAAPDDGERDRLAAELDQTRAELERIRADADAMRAERAALEARAAEAAALQDRLRDAVGGDGEVSGDGSEIHLQLVDKVLFRVGEADLTERGRAVLAQLGAALDEAADKQVWVQGHTDDTPIRAARGVVPRFASNWELSAARALTVVHYLQDEAGIDPRRLAAVAFGPYRPASRIKARNRRIEIVLYPHHQLARD